MDAEELKKLLVELQNPARTLVFLTAATGLRVSEALGLKWSDDDFGAGVINLGRAIVHQHVDEMKKEASQKPLPMDGRWPLRSAIGVTQALIPSARRLGVRQPKDGEATLLAGNTTEVLCTACR